jgi:predicted XRE-type DNA-binding protein
MAKRNEAAKDGIERGTGNVFADLGYADAKERQTKLRLAFAINQIIEQRKLTQAKAATALGLPQPKVSLLSRYKLEGFSVERLMTFLTLLDQDVEISIKNSSWRSNGKITVITA